VVLIAVGTVVVGVVSFVSCFGGEKKKTVKSAPVEKESVPVQAPSKTKKRSKPRNKSKKSSSGNATAESSSEVEPTPVVTSSVPVKVVNDEEDKGDEDDEEEDFFVKSDSSKKVKKAKETQEQKASRVERQKQQKASKADEGNVFFNDSATSSAGHRQSEHSSSQGVNPPSYDGWAVVENPRKLKKKSESASDLEDLPPLVTVAPTPAPAAVAQAAEDVPPPAPIDSVTKELTVESRKLGLLIGPKGVTKIGMQTATGTDISMPKVEKDFSGPVSISVTGTAQGVDRAVAALNELCVKGYSTLLATPDFHEGYVEVKHKFLSDIIGKGGCNIRAIQSYTGVKIITPSDSSKVLPSGETVTPSKVRVILAGARDKVAEARSLILDLCKYYYTPVTHPGVTHVEMDINPRYYNYVIGSKGSEIKHIQANYKVSVHIPDADSANQNLLIIGEAGNAANAEKHIMRLMEKVDERAKAEAEGIALGESAKARLAAAGGADGAPAAPRRERAPRAPKEAATPADPSASRGPKDPNAAAEDEAWTAEYAPRRAPINLGAMLPTSAKFAAVAASPVAPVEEAEVSAL